MQTSWVGRSTSLDQVCPEVEEKIPKETTYICESESFQFTNLKQVDKQLCLLKFLYSTKTTR